jgi:hypothetical protein
MTGLTFKEIWTSDNKHFIVIFQVIDYGTTIHQAVLNRKQTLKFKDKKFLCYPTKYDYVGLSFVKAIENDNEVVFDKNIHLIKLKQILKDI